MTHPSHNLSKLPSLQQDMTCIMPPDLSGRLENASLHAALANRPLRFHFNGCRAADLNRDPDSLFDKAIA